MVNYFDLRENQIYDIVCDTTKSFLERYEAYKHLWAYLDLEVLQKLVQLHYKGKDVTKLVNDYNYRVFKKKFALTLDIVEFEERRLLEEDNIQQKISDEAKETFIDILNDKLRN